MQLKPFKDLIAMSKEKIDEALAPIRARRVQSKAALEMSRLEEKKISLEVEIQELCAKEDINFDELLDKINLYDLNERRLKQYGDVLEQLFPKEG